MEQVEEVKKRGRGRPRKRRRNEEEAEEKKAGLSAAKKQALDFRWRPLVGRYVLKEFEGSGIFLGKIVFYDSGLYRVDYEDGDFEDLESRELRDIILGDDDFDLELCVRRGKLDEAVAKKSVKSKKDEEKEVVDVKNDVKAEVSLGTEVTGSLKAENNGGLSDNEDDGADSSSDSCEYAQDTDPRLAVETPAVPPPELPPSSGTVGVPEECVSYLFSVYTFLRSFSIRLFLNPFPLNDFVGAINCCAQNTLMDAVHVALLRALRRHLEALSSDGLELASKCLRCVDWSLLDSLTWTVYLVHYFTVMGYAKGSEWKGFYDNVWKSEYYSVPARSKLMILQILCDDVLESMQLRTEIDMLEESELGIDPDGGSTYLSENGPRTVHPRYSKTSACKDREAMEIIAESEKTRSSYSSIYLGPRGAERDADAPVDANGDECRLCGMDGTLLCCDGCPSSYHSRCIGVGKNYIPEGTWFCPECSVNKLGPTIAMGASLRGAEIFGIDIYEQVFLGTCNHLLVLRASLSREPCFRYYNQMDIPRVLQALSASAQHRSLYLEIFKAIAEYWHISHQDIVETSSNMEPTKEDEKFAMQPLVFPCNESCKGIDVFDTGKAISLNESNVDNVAASSLDIPVAAKEQTVVKGVMVNGVVGMESGHIMNKKLNEQVKMESDASQDLQTDPSDITHQSLVGGSSAVEVTTCMSANSVGSHVVLSNGSLLKASSRPVCVPVEGNSMINCLYMGTSFKPNVYINHYMHGEYAASAASNLAILSSEDTRGSEAQKYGNGKKVVSDILLQSKAFSSTASRFFWPSSEKKLVEVPRERCGWCHSCKLTSNSRRGCMLNSAALSATKVAMKIISSMGTLMNGDGSLPSIATYILYMGDVLSGLTVGPFLSASYRKRWRKQVEDASTYSSIKGPLLELEENIRSIALSLDWVKAMDDWLIESSTIQSATSTAGTSQRRRPNGKRHKKQSVTSDVAGDDSDERSFVWWRGGKLLKLVFKKAILPRALVRRVARQAGSRKFPGVQYGDELEIPKRSRQLFWRAAVESSKNASQLALQVRQLDFHVRWGDLVRPDQNLQEGKGLETEASVFRNAFICDKKVEQNKIRYGVAFGNQKHLPSRIMKNIIEVEQLEDGKEKFWFSELHIPLYLIKEFEEKVNETVLPIAKMPLNELSELQRRQLKAARRDIFLYLTCKRDKLDSCCCASCQRDALLRNTVKCSACQGYCHEDCTVSSTIYSNEEVEFLITCKRCYGPTMLYKEKSNESTTSPLPVQARECPNAVSGAKGTRIKLQNQPLVSLRTQDSCSEVKQASPVVSTKKQNRSCHWGVIWKKKNLGDGVEFRRQNILLSGSSDGKRLMPVCNLCGKAYNCNLMYIYCAYCKHWFHAEAVGLYESKLCDVVGFKCCRCRRIKSPTCPYEDTPKGEKSDGQRSRKKVLSRGNVGVDSDSGTIAESAECEPTTPMFPTGEVCIQDGDPLLFSLSRVEQITERNRIVELEFDSAGPGPRKLPVRRHMKCQGDVESSMPSDTNDLMKPEEKMPSCWDASGNGLENGMQFDYEGFNFEDMEFEPQTYFSYTELLESDDGNQLGEIDASQSALLNCENQPNTALQNGVLEQYVMGTPGDLLEPTISLESVVQTIPCKTCLQVEPVPDLLCQNCGLAIHSHCSPWEDSSPAEGGWYCGNCREWR
ncbi:hypothetical protein Tsubulata_029025 [Turnera subulata]|uniref:PHD-type domain-containing protein n=1 Tax=Turnera subulata TaxID=218843 RepID=A0A9Q0JJ55_9ROSI|nr:hypothetical protein Tsubulata_029025 [Turnera subulata]